MTDVRVNAGEMAENQAAVFDVRELEERCFGNSELVERILAQVETEVAHECQKLLNAVQQADRALLATAAHRLKGTAANIGATRIKNAVDSIEDASRDLAPWSQLEKMFREVHEEQARLIEVVNRHVTRQMNGGEV